jgi:alkylhydroperoxidase family enzyme
LGSGGPSSNDSRDEGTDEPPLDPKEGGMARLRVLEKNQLTPRLAKYAERASAAGPEQATMFQVLGHCPEMFEAYFQFYFTWHTAGSVDAVLKELVRIRIAQLNDCFT